MHNHENRCMVKFIARNYMQFQPEKSEPQLLYVVLTSLIHAINFTEMFTGTRNITTALSGKPFHVPLSS